MTKLYLTTMCLLIASALCAQNLMINIHHEANGVRLEKDSLHYTIDSIPYHISLLKYYVGTFVFTNKTGEDLKVENIQLIDGFQNAAFAIPLASGEYKSVRFMLGVDSVLQAAGVQEGALDPLNNMYWAWNSGYVNFKLEGSSDSSTADRHRIEQHIGGYAGKNKTMQWVRSEFKKNLIVDGSAAQNMLITIDLDKYWSSEAGNIIKNRPVLVRMGDDAVSLSKRLPALFYLEIKTSL